MLRDAAGPDGGGRGGRSGAASRLLGYARRSEHALTVIVAIAIGLLAGGGAIGFRYLIKVVHRGFFQTWDYGTHVAESLPFFVVLLLPAAGGLLVGPIVRWVAPEVRGSGIPEVMESVALRGGFIRLRVVLAKALAAALTIGSGGSAGREGPIVQVGAGIGSGTGQILAVDAQRLRTFVACGAAAAIAATFNAPIAGALFAVEVILGEFAILHFSPVVISSVAATVLSRHFLGDFPAFDVPHFDLVSAQEFLPYTALGLLAGLLSVGFIHGLYKSQDLFERSPIPAVLRPAAGGLLVGAIAIGLPEVLGVGYETVNGALWDRLPLWALLAFPAAKLVATSATLGSGGSGGIFAPSLFIGAMLGGAVGTGAAAWLPAAAHPGAYALVGMGALVAGTTHGPISAILIIFELTGDYRIIPPLMLACVTSVLLSSWIQPFSVYTLKLAKRGVNLRERQNVNLLKGLRVREVIDAAPERIPATTTLPAVIDRVIHSDRDSFFVVADGDRLLGTFTLSDLRELFLEQDLPAFVLAADLPLRDIPAVRASDNLDFVMHVFGQHDVAELAVVSRGAKPRVVGSVRRSDVIDAYNREIFRLDLTGGFHSVATSVEGDRGVEVAPGHNMAEVDVPFGFVGRSLAELGVRERYGVQVILVRKPLLEETLPDDTGVMRNRPATFARPDYVLEPGDRLLLLGAPENIRRLKAGVPLERTEATGGPGARGG